MLTSLYDLKSGISHLTDEALAKMAILSTKTAVATKATSEEMGKLFALGYGLFRKEFDSDSDFAEKLSTAIAHTVQSARTTGSDIYSGLATLGSSANAFKLPFAQQMAILGLAKEGYDTASEAATGLTGLLNSLVRGQEGLLSLIHISEPTRPY